MSKFLNSTLLCVAFLGMSLVSAEAEDVAAGKKVFKKCAACHTVGDGAQNKAGPQLNDIFGRVSGSLEGFKYSKAMIAAGEEGIVWEEDTLDEFLIKPKQFIKKTKMAFAGLKKEKDRVNLIAYLKTFDPDTVQETESPAEKPTQQEAKKPEEKPQEVASNTQSQGTPNSSHGNLKLGRIALGEEVAAWDIDIRPDGKGLPKGSGTVLAGEEIYSDYCAACHGDFGEGIDRWPVLAGGHDTLEEDRPEKTIGSYWPYTSTVYDYIRRAMPFGDARSLSDDDVYALTAYVLYLNDIIVDEDFELNNENFNDIRLPNEENFVDDSRYQEVHYSNKSEPCMLNCKPEPATITMRARVLDVTPETE